jgi:ADP-heptose:LPS heptosyltransferase
MKAICVRTSSIGDVVHTLPALAALHRAGWEAGWVVEPPSRVLLEQNPLVAQVVQAPARKAFGLAGALRALRALRAERYDVALDFRGLWKSAARRACPALVASSAGTATLAASPARPCC